MPPDDKQGYLNYIDADGNPADGELHEEILAQGDVARAKAITRRRLLERGWPEEEVDEFLREA
jgi:hypothetical protein